MIVRISNCNNISSGDVSIEENRLNIKYAINGTGKSTVAKAIEYAAAHDTNGLKSLTPYAYIGTTDVEQLPSVEGLPENLTVAIFDEAYVNQYVFLEDELVKNSFDIFIKTENYERQLSEINELVSNIRNIFDDNPELDGLISAMSEFISSFGNARAGIANNGALIRGLGSGNLIQNIPQGLEDYSAFLTDNKNSKWLKWQSDGRTYMDIGTKCPFCAGDLAPQREKIERIKTEYDAKNIEHLAKILDIFERLGQYFSDETNARVREITTNVRGLSDEQKNYLVSIKNDVEVLQGKLQALKRIGFDSLKDIDRLADALENYKIDMQFISHLNTPFTAQKVDVINDSIEHLRGVVGNLQGAVNRQKAEIQRTVQAYNDEINGFLQMAGYSYTVSIEETADHSYKLKLKFGDVGTPIAGVKSHLSFGERNAFALVLFMYNALYTHADFIILDDPISSFDKNKKFAILDMLFIRGRSLRGKTALLLTHDLEPVIDCVYNHPAFFDTTPKAVFCENVGGTLCETEITRDDIQSSIQIANENIANRPNAISRLIFLRRLIEIIEGKNAAWHLLSNLFHRREIPNIGDEPMTEEAVADGVHRIQESLPDFDYPTYYGIVSNDGAMIDLYHHAGSNYEKLQVYRILFDPTDEEHVMRKFLNETYHSENDYLFQLNPLRFNTIPTYIISECDNSITELEAGRN